MVRRGVSPGERQFAKENVLVDERERGPPKCPEPDQRRAEIAAGMQLFVDPGFLNTLFVISEFAPGAVARRQCFVHALCREIIMIHVYLIGKIAFLILNMFYAGIKTLMVMNIP